MNRFPVLLAALVISGASSHAGDLDPAGFAESMPGASWKQVMKEFKKLDRNDDGLLSRTEREIKGEIHRGYRNLYYIPDEAQEGLPLKWTAGVNIVWDDHTASGRTEFWRLLMTVRSLRPAQRAAAWREWLQLRKAAREAT